MTYDELDDMIAEMTDEPVLLADGLEDAFVGLARQHPGGLCAVYDVEKCIQILMRDEMTYEEAAEYMDFNVTCAYVGEHTPMFMHSIEAMKVLR